jgi:hypothetical protein
MTAQERRAVYAGVLMIVLACLLLAGREEGRPAYLGLGDGVLAAGAELRTFDACDPLLEHLRTEALERVTAYGLQGSMSWGPVEVVAEAAAEAGVLDAAAPGLREATGSVGDGSHSTTNVQVAGVDEPDIVKTDGRRVLVLTEGELHVTDVTGDRPRVLGSWTPQGWWPESLLLHGDRVLVLGGGGEVLARPEPGFEVQPDTGAGAGPRQRFGQGSGGGPALDPGPWTDPSRPLPTPDGRTFRVALLDISDPARITAVSQFAAEGSHVAARLVDDVARLVVRTEPGAPPAVHHDGTNGGSDALEANRAAIRDATIDRWLPWSVRQNADGTRSEGPLLDCRRLHAPATFSGFGTLTVLTVGMQDASLPRDATGILAGAETVHADGERLHVATNRWVDWQRLSPEDQRALHERYTTEVHAFDTSDTRATRYVASGQVEGRLLDQWALDRHAGHLRVATTEGTPWGDGPTSESAVTVLAERGRELVQVGRVAGMGIGERIYAVRFLGDVGYVVTFREVDPLYTLDLRDPAAPQVTGELKITGYSSYLHPVGDGLLLGVGQDATEQGVVTGTQLSLFDVSDPAAPTRLHQVTLPGGTSEVEHDHRAFLHWTPTGLTVVPVEQRAWDEPAGGSTFLGALGYELDRENGFLEVGRVTHVRDDAGAGGWGAPVRRSLVVADRLLTVSDRGLLLSDLGTLAEVAWLDL